MSFLEQDRTAIREGTQPSAPPMPRDLIVRALHKRTWWPVFAGVVALASLAVFVIAPPATTSKGGSRVSVFIKRGTDTLLWNGAQSLRVGDRIQLVVEPKGHVTVYDDTGATLYDGDGGQLPLSWRVEGGGSHERLIVVVDGARTELTLPKEPAL